MRLACIKTNQKTVVHFPNIPTDRVYEALVYYDGQQKTKGYTLLHCKPKAELQTDKNTFRDVSMCVFYRCKQCKQPILFTEYLILASCNALYSSTQTWRGMDRTANQLGMLHANMLTKNIGGERRVTER